MKTSRSIAMSSPGRIVRGALAAAGVAVGLAMGGTMLTKGAGATEVIVYKSPWCGCCGGWVDHMRENGFSLMVREVEDLDPIRAEHGVTGELMSCHTAVVDGYVVEGHVPATDVRRLLQERPEAKGLTAPGMPGGSPGMEGAGKEPYNVLLFTEDGDTRVFASH